MQEREWISVRGATLTPEQKQRLRESRRWVEENKDEITRDALRAKAEIDAAHAAMKLLQAERKRRGMSLDQVAQAAGMDKGRLSRLENDLAANPTFSTVLRVADAIGVRLTLGISDKEAA